MGISLLNVTFSYPNRTEKLILKIPKWKIESGESVLIHGSSGSGKTTFLNLIAGLLRPLEGSVTVLEKRIDKLSSLNCDHFRANNIGYVSQKFNLIPYLNILDNIRLATTFSKSSGILYVENEIIKLLRTLNVAESDWKLKSKDLSFGQIQRVAIARAMINRPKIIIADEPTSSLDASNKDAFMSLLITLAKKYKTILVFVSHDQSLSSYFNRIELFSNINIVDKN